MTRLALTSLVLVLGATTACASNTPAPLPRTTQPTDQTSQPTPSEPPSESPGDSGSTDGDPEAVGTLVDLLEVPWGVDFLPDGNAVVTERMTGRVLQVEPDGTLSRLGAITASVPQGEAGLLGVAVSPDFDTDSTLFFYLTSSSDNRVVRAELDGGQLGEPTVVLDGIPAGFIHDGGRIAFGPDGYLYVTTGETGDPALAQDPDSLAGKILRITADGDPAPGNPDPGSPVWSLGHRNVQGLAWDDQDRLWASEFGDSDVGRAQPHRGGRQLRLARGRGHRRRVGVRRPRAGLAGRGRLAERAGVRRRPPLDGRAPRSAALADQGVRERARPPSPRPSSPRTTAGSGPS